MNSQLCYSIITMESWLIEVCLHYFTSFFPNWLHLSKYFYINNFRLEVFMSQLTVHIENCVNHKPSEAFSFRVSAQTLMGHIINGKTPIAGQVVPSCWDDWRSGRLWKNTAKSSKQRLRVKKCFTAVLPVYRDWWKIGWGKLKRFLFLFSDPEKQQWEKP